MKKTIQTIFTTSLALVCTFFVQQLSAKEIVGNELPEPWLIAKVKNDTRFTAHVTVYYTTAPNKPETFDVGPHSSGQGGDRKLLIKSVSATYDANGSGSVTQKLDFVAPASTAYGEFVIKEEAVGAAGEFACVIYRVDESGTQINRVKPGFVFKNNTKYILRVGVSIITKAGNTNIKKTKDIAAGEEWTEDLNSGNYDIGLRIYKDSYELSADKVLDMKSLSVHESGAPQLWSTATYKPTFAITFGNVGMQVTKTYLGVTTTL